MNNERIIQEGRMQILLILIEFTIAQTCIFFVAFPTLKHVGFLIFNSCFIILFYLTFRGLRYAAIMLGFVTFSISIGSIIITTAYVTKGLKLNFFKINYFIALMVFSINNIYVTLSFVFSKKIGDYILYMKKSKQERLYNQLHGIEEPENTLEE